jgi:hypothetical protein
MRRVYRNDEAEPTGEYEASVWFIWSIWFVLLLEPEKPNKQPVLTGFLDEPS